MKKIFTIALALSALGMIIGGCSGGDAADSGTGTSASGTSESATGESK